MICQNPPYLKEGSHVRILSTARKVDLDFIERSTKLAKRWGLNVSHGKTLSLSHHQFAGSITERVEDLQHALDDPNVDAIWCARGGYGTVSLLDFIDFDTFIRNPKWVIGYSDITGLLSHINKLGISGIHGPMPVNVKSENQVDLNALKSLLFGEKVEYPLNSHPLSIPGDFEGILLGGNISVIYSILGSASICDFTDCVLFLEDLDEYLYHVDRMMLNIQRNGLLKNLSGVLIGGITDMHDNTIPFGKTGEEIIYEYVKDLGVPVYFGVQSGHCTPNLPLVFGQKVSVRNNCIHQS